MDRIEEKLDKIVEHMSEMSVTLGKQSVILEEHVKRTNILEAKLAPVEKHIARVEGAMKLVGLLGVGTALVQGIRSLFGK